MASFFKRQFKQFQENKKFYLGNKFRVIVLNYIIPFSLSPIVPFIYILRKFYNFYLFEITSSDRIGPFASSFEPYFTKIFPELKKKLKNPLFITYLKKPDLRIKC